MKYLHIFLLFTLIVAPNTLFAHSGGIDSRGGHHCRTNCEDQGYYTNQYHYHPEKMDEKQLKDYTNFKDRLCNRVEKRFSTDENMLKRVNDRIERRFGFTCNS